MWDDESRYTPARNAWQKAQRLEKTADVVWDKEERCWLIASATNPGGYYAVFVLPEVSNKRPWWERLSCTCAAADAGRIVCWHRARVALHWRREETRPNV